MGGKKPHGLPLGPSYIACGLMIGIIYVNGTLRGQNVVQEERVRSGEDGPASATAVLQPSAERVISSPSALEQALRASLSQMIQGNEMFSQAEVDSLQNSVGKTQEMLLESTQAANSVRQPGGSNEMEHFSETMVAVEAVDAELLNEQIVRTSLTQQDLTSQVQQNSPE